MNMGTAESSKMRFLDFDHAKGALEFIAIGRPKAIKIHGKGESPKGKLKILTPSKVEGDLLFSLDSLDTGITLRNEHMKKKYLEIDKFPVAKLTEIVRLLSKDDKGSHENVPFQGQLTLHGITQTIHGLSTLKNYRDKINLEVTFALKLSSFGISIPTFAGITVADEVQVLLSTEVQMISQ